MTSRYIDPFDFEKIKNYFIGNDSLFAFLIIILCSYAAAYFNMPTKIYFFILSISLILFGAFVGEEWYTLVLLLLGGVIFKKVSEMMT